MPSRREFVAYLLMVAAALLYFRHRLHADFGVLRVFWDARVYAGALGAWRGGLNPYAGRPGEVLPFVGPPVFLWGMAGLSRVFPGAFGFGLYCAVGGVCTLAAPTILALGYMRGGWGMAALAVGVTWFLPGHYGSQAMLTGNFSNVLYAALLAAGVPGLRRNRWGWFYAVVVVAGLVKPPFLAFLLLPLLAGSGQWLASGGAVVAVLAGDGAQRLLWPGYWGNFERRVAQRVFAEGDAGFGVMGQMARLGVRAPVATGLVLGVLVGLVVALARRRRGRPVERIWPACLVVLAVLCNPRTLAYEANVVVAPALWIAVETLRSLRPGWLRWLPMGVCVVLFVGLEAADAELGVCVLMVMAVGMVVCQLAWPGWFCGRERLDAVG